MSKTTAENGTVTTSANMRSEPVMLRERIGSTTYEVSVHFSKTSKETMQDKLLRLIEQEMKYVA